MIATRDLMLGILVDNIALRFCLPAEQALLGVENAGHTNNSFA
jgi:hypothetical protein